MHRKIHTISFSILLALCLVSTSFVTNSAAINPDFDSVPTVIYSDSTEIEETDRINYEEVASNQYCILYADMEKGYFALKSIDTGDMWYSTPNDVTFDDITSGIEKYISRSQIYLEYLYNDEITNSKYSQTADSYRDCVESGNVTVERINDGIEVMYYFSDIDVTIPVDYRLENNSLVASIDLERVDEGDSCSLISITLLPYFGAGNSRTEGKLLVPDGSGALIHFNNGANTQIYTSMVYGDPFENTFSELDKNYNETVRLPVFATLMDKKALMGIITEGDGSAAIRAVNGNEDRGYNAVASTCVLRNLEQLIMFRNMGDNRRDIGRLTAWPNGSEKYTVRYTPLSGENSDYVGVAKNYRNYLINEKGLTKHSTEPSLSLDVYGSIDVKAAFLGFEYRKQKTLTSYEELLSIINDLRAKGINKISVRYLGWGGYGMLNNKLITEAKTRSNLGGKSDLRKLIETIDESKDTIYFDVDFLRYRSASKSKAITNSFNQKVEYTERMRSVYANKINVDPIYFLSPQYIASNAFKYLSTLPKYNINSVSLSTLGEYCYSNDTERNNKGFHRYFYPTEAVKILKKYQEDGIDISLEQANAFAAVYADRIYNAPIFSSGYDIFDEEIPFYQIVFHGFTALTSSSMSQSSETDLNILKAAESGSELLYGCMYEDSSVITNTRFDYLYSTQYSLWSEKSLQSILKHQELIEQVYDQEITEHRELMTDVMVTTFANGIKVIVNYNNNEVNINGNKILARDYVVLKGESL